MTAQAKAAAPAAGMRPDPGSSAGAGAAPTSWLRHAALASLWSGTYFVVTPVYTVLLQLRVAELVTRADQGFAIGLATALGGALAAAVPPLVGALSDRLRSRRGRRRPFMAAGVLGVVAALLVMGHARSYLLLAMGFVMVVASTSVVAGAYAGVIPDLVRGSETGLASGLLGLFVQLGSATSLLATLLLVQRGQVQLLYGVMSVVVVLALLPTLAAASDSRPATAPERPRLGVRGFLRPLWSGDFGRAFFTRFLSMSAFAAVLPFLLLAFRDLFRLAHPAAFASLFVLTVTVVAVPFAVLGGRLSDRCGRKRFVYLAGGLQAVTLLCLLAGSALPLPLLCALGGCYGAGYGIYSAVDWALGIDTLPDRERPAKDLGLYHVADSLPRVLVPLVVGLALDAANRAAPDAGYRGLFAGAALLYLGGAALVSRIRSVG